MCLKQTEKTEETQYVHEKPHKRSGKPLSLKGCRNIGEATCPTQSKRNVQGGICHLHVNESMKTANMSKQKTRTREERTYSQRKALQRIRKKQYVH